MMTLLNQVKELVAPVISDEMMEGGYQEFSITDDNLVVDIECEHYVDWIAKNGTLHCVIAPKKVLAYLSDEEGNFGEPVDFTREFSDYKYRLFN